MVRFTSLFVLPILVAALIQAAGCNSSDPAAVPPAGQTGTGGTAQADHDHSPEAMAKVKEALAKLSPEDAAAAEKQHICPVSQAMLGTMGAPPKVDVNGTPVFICCEGCRDKLLKEPDKYLAQLKKNSQD